MQGAQFEQKAIISKATVDLDVPGAGRITFQQMSWRDIQNYYNQCRALGSPTVEPDDGDSDVMEPGLRTVCMVVAAVQQTRPEATFDEVSNWFTTEAESRALMRTIVNIAETGEMDPEPGPEPEAEPEDADAEGNSPGPESPNPPEATM